MSDLRDLYQEVIIDHNRSPHNYGAIDQPSRNAKGFNPLCGDKLELSLKIKDDVIIDAKFQGCGCAISTASASLMTDSIKGKSIKDAELLFNEVHHMLTDKQAECHERLGKLAVLSGVKAYPSRVKCATLAWHTLHNAIGSGKTVATTE